MEGGTALLKEGNNQAENEPPLFMGLNKGN